MSGRGVDARRGDDRACERDAARAPGRRRRLRRARPPLAGRSGVVLAALRRRPRDRVLAAVGPGARRVARAGMDDLVRRRHRQHRPELRPPLGRPSPRRGCGRRARRGRLAQHAHLRRALPRRDAARRGARRARRRGGRPRRDLPADVAGGRGRVACDRAHRRRPGADLLRVRRAGRRPAARGERGEGRDQHGASRRGAGAACRCSRSSRRRSARRARRRTSCSRRSSSTAGRAACRRSRSTPRRRTC